MDVPGEYSYEEKPGTAPIESLVGTTWHHCDAPKSEVTFEENHKLTVRVDGRSNVEGGCAESSNRWTQEKHRVTFVTCDYGEWNVLINVRDRTIMKGTWHFIKGKTEYGSACLIKNMKFF